MNVTEELSLQRTATVCSASISFPSTMHKKVIIGTLYQIMGLIMHHRFIRRLEQASSTATGEENAPLISITAKHYYRIVGKQVWKNLTRSSRPATCSRQEHPQLNHPTQVSIQVYSENLKGWRLHNFSKQSIPMPDHPYSQKALPNFQPKFPLLQLELLLPILSPTAPEIIPSPSSIIFL